MATVIENDTEEETDNAVSLEDVELFNRGLVRRERPERLDGHSYKIKNVPNGQNDNISFYVTINNDENNRPFELFIDCRDMLLYEFLTAIGRQISLMLQFDIPVMYIVDELKDIHSGNTGHYIPGTGIYCNSLVAHIAHKLEEHYLNNSK